MANLNKSIKNTFWLICFIFLIFSCSPNLRIYDTVHPNDLVEEDSLSLVSPTVEFTENQTKLLNDALVIANNSIRDSLFERILLAQSEDKIYQWDGRRLNKVDIVHHNAPVDYFLSEFRNRGLPVLNQLAGRNNYKRKSVTGSTVPCKENIYFNVKKLDKRLAVFVAGTIVHERLHSFCLQHQSNNVKKEFNLCDFAYHAGHMAIIIAQYRQNNSQPIKKPLIPICKTLVEKLKAEKIIK